ncbi:UDP-N-acetylglucosamine pyrophosphorylase [Taphrina deformans PYCC 5710]|uniref:UDP-N-acetylglucosamine diphosphorylase n=1 Tax=Taphrina deformans (strain PYCC 5710 / ATCC 11124 / CBS 356.35 / IMI 108563 / JCM 9778 / NBRC 8474) TaxID=1097556 RepID=R4XAW6_TAPDE|nr:UDP-N-acetylglucosamine pyrophosphorylase [Taphrina deformans PYCC 5710]|eukprot:CCG82699.1 UDP-N-acetylglucosamine pyrophosphorylase [Taphrina deformans PYCC 5710]
MDTLKKFVGLQVGEDSSLQPPTEGILKETQNKYDKAEQGHVFQLYQSLSPAEKATLYKQASEIDPEHINSVVQQTKQENKDNKDELSPLPEQVCASLIDCEAEDKEKWYKLGLDLASQGKVAVIVMAGGQGTRLGSSAPKGCFDIGLPSHKSLFQLQAERINKVGKLAQKRASAETLVAVPWYIMTSGPTRQSTEEFFTQHDHFGLSNVDVKFFDQGTLPCIDNDGKIILESPSKIAVAPDGNGGIYNALITGGVLEDMERRGIEHVQVYCVDNCLAKVADPTFFGWAASRKLDIATKVVRKRNPQESVGLVMLRNGKPDVVEYSEIDKATTEEKEASGLLRYRTANIVQHYYSYKFLAEAPRWASTLPHHVAKKKIPYYDLEAKEVVKPDSPNGIKMEQFVFDVFPLIPLEKFGCLEVAREDEFSPLKNATGEDSAETSRKDLLQQGAKWVTAAGGYSVDDGAAGGNDGVEISPLISYGGEGLEGHVKGQEIRGLGYIEARTT